MPIKMFRYGLSFLRRRLIHTNLQLHYRCNFRCQICDFRKPEYQARPALTVEQVKTIGRKLAEVGPQIVSIGGGEPLLHDDLVGVVEALARDHFPVMICNGWLIDRENAKALFRAGMHEISISVDYADATRL
jgi:MoaA/NifB/PqqE/SkfB family radical SAM enzyme